MKLNGYRMDILHTTKAVHVELVNYCKLNCLIMHFQSLNIHASIFIRYFFIPLRNPLNNSWQSCILYWTLNRSLISTKDQIVNKQKKNKKVSDFLTKLLLSLVDIDEIQNYLSIRLKSHLTLSLFIKVFSDIRSINLVWLRFKKI